MEIINVTYSGTFCHDTEPMWDLRGSHMCTDGNPNLPRYVDWVSSSWHFGTHCLHLQNLSNTVTTLLQPPDPKDEAMHSSEPSVTTEQLTHWNNFFFFFFTSPTQLHSFSCVVHMLLTAHTILCCDAILISMPSATSCMAEKSPGYGVFIWKRNTCNTVMSPSFLLDYVNTEYTESSQPISLSSWLIVCCLTQRQTV